MLVMEDDGRDGVNPVAFGVNDFVDEGTLLIEFYIGKGIQTFPPPPHIR